MSKNSKRSKKAKRLTRTGECEELGRLYRQIECHEAPWHVAKDVTAPAPPATKPVKGDDAEPQMKNESIRDVQSEVVKGFTRDILHVAESDIKLADFIVRNNRREGVPDDPESTRKLRLSFRRIRYRLATMASIDATLGAENLIGRLRDVGKPMGRLRDAEILESSVVDALGDLADTPQGRQLMEIAAHARRVEQQTTDDLLCSEPYRETLNEVSEFRSSLPSRHSTPDMLRPMAERAMRGSWRKLRKVALKAKRDPSDINLHHARIAAKRTLYVAQALSDVLGTPVEEFVRKVDEFQKYLGKQHDLVIASKWFTRVSKDYPALRSVARSLARKERKRADKRSKRWIKYWKDVEAHQPSKRW